ncbi:MAG: hypothetical protein C5B50_20300 [Verrucomicrobia bacterium]|nr:MAG: hypothetical protein C5B50_20300 [Verrucomicrobiota bacterium]
MGANGIEATAEDGTDPLAIGFSLVSKIFSICRHNKAPRILPPHRDCPKLSKNCYAQIPIPSSNAENQRKKRCMFGNFR